VGVVRTRDGVRLHVEVDELDGAPVTVVFSHGFTAELGEFLLQREALQGRARVVLYDQRGHGRSDPTHGEHATIDQLGRDLQAVLDATCPTGPVVLVGHSMGGMTLMSWARQHPHEVGSRVVGAYLLATSAGDLVSTGPLGHAVRLLTRLHLLAFWLWLVRLLAPAIARVRKPGTRLGYHWVRRYLFGTHDADPQLVLLVQAMLEATDFRTSAAFYPTFLTHDERAALPLLARIPTSVVCGTADRLTPVSHSRQMAAALGATSSLVEVPGCGHSVNVTRPEVVNAALFALLERAVPLAAT
jgi:pimeloyl-ACP methyl ester carboxylesterase